MATPAAAATTKHPYTPRNTPQFPPDILVIAPETPNGTAASGGEAAEARFEEWGRRHGRFCLDLVVVGGC